MNEIDYMIKLNFGGIRKQSFHLYKYRDQASKSVDL